MHNIRFSTFSETAKKNNMVSCILSSVKSHGDGYGTERINFNDFVFESYEAAEKFVLSDPGFYAGCACKYRDLDALPDTQKEKDLEKRIGEIYATMLKYTEEHSIQKRKANTIACPKCQSKLNKSYLHSDFCPLCHCDLRSQTTVAQIKKYKERIDKSKKQLQAERIKRNNQAPIKWLVKWEFHS